jgi:pimeloyl-ACP methyl ester carboxylesterase
MNIREFGNENGPGILLLHPSLVSWDYFERLIPLLAEDYRLYVPAVPGYDMEDDSEFSSVEEIAVELEEALLARGVRQLKAIYGCSMGGSITLRMAVDGKVPAEHYILDGGITPYQLPWLLTRFIALRDFGTMALGKLGGEKLMIKAFSGTSYGEDDLKYIADIMKHCSYRTFWNTFDSCNNYRMPKAVMHFSGKVHYWYGEKERKVRDWDLKYMKKFIPDTRFRKIRGADHGDMAWFYPDRMAAALRRL